MSKMLTMKEVIFPQALAVSVPGICANVIFLIKETSVVSGIALADLMYVTKDLIGLYYETDKALIMLVVFYLIILLPISILSSYLERHLLAILMKTANIRAMMFTLQNASPKTSA